MPGMAQAQPKTSKRKAPQALRRGTPAAASSAAERRCGRFTFWHVGSASVLVFAAFLRLFDLSSKVLHHDEGVNGMFMTNLFRTGYYHYDPANYHGPTLYYAGLVTTTLNAFAYGKYGLSTFAIRLVTATFGIGVVWLSLCLRRYLGTFGSWSAALLATVSSGMVFFSRYFIHEILFVFFTLGTVVAWLKFRETGQSKYLYLAASSLSLLGATKETWIITLAVWLIAIPCTTYYLKFAERALNKRPDMDLEIPPVAPQESRRTLYSTAVIVFVVLWVLFYSSFFTNFPQGVLDSIRTYGYWTKTSGTANIYPWTQDIDWLFRAETGALLLGAAGIIAALVQVRSRFAVFTAFWSMGILAAYCLVPYKTPWLLLSIVLPFLLMSGYLLEQIFARRGSPVIASLILAVAAGLGLYQGVQVSFFRYDDASQPYSYAHSYRDLLNLVNEVEKIASGLPEGRNTGITVMSTEHWPLPWYLRFYPNTGFWGKVVPTNEPIIIAHQTQVDEVNRELGSKYRLISSHDLRPGNRLYLYVRKDIQP
ncbi:MAG TPA: flippase activity-associated protein Agl23 [Candidatus Limnocylindrales bacterium]|jgi:uncharacterized protein (TIGR03663 family)|nr:flippase activity-associated protein Agl23 [Candidatus Limnocylindrales bacterium]